MSRLASIILAFVAIAAAVTVPALAVPYDALVTGNPIVPGYFADPCCRKFGDTYYLYVTPDGWNVGEGPFCIWTSKDFVHWTANKSNWPITSQKWAPSVVFNNGKYYMYTQVPCQVYVATADTPLGPWANAIAGGGPMIPDQTPSGTITLDGECYIDTDGQAYLYYGTWWTPTVVKLNADLISTVSGSAIQYFTHTGYTPPKGTVTGCMEAPYMFKRNGIYYYMYSNNFCGDSSYQVEYSTSTAGPLGPWTYGANNPILSTNIDGTVDGPGHHTILEDNGKVYIIYHRHDNPHDPDGSHRQIAIDELHFNTDGSIEKLVPSHSGTRYLAPSTKRDTNLAVGKPATASSSAGADFLPGNAADENNGTLWKASSYSYPQWLQVDLGESCTVKRCETEFQFAQVAYKYQIQYSTNGTTWTTFVDRRTNTNWGPMVDSVATAVTARYIKITMTGDDTSSRPSPDIAIWNFKVYDGIDKPNQAPVVDVGAGRTGTTSFLTLPISGSVIDDGLPNGPVSYTWSKLSGPGTVTFKNADRLDTTATFGSAGTYVLQLDANDGALTGSDTVTYDIVAPGDKVIEYPLDESKGVWVTDISNNARDGVLTNGPVRGSGAVGRSVNFDGSNDYIAVPNLLTYNSASVSAWVKPDTLVSYGSIICGNGSATGTPYLSIQSTGKIQFSLVGANPVNQTSTFQFTSDTLGKWTHVAAVYDKTAKTVSFYVNGVLDSTKSYTTVQNVVLASGARVGGWDGGGRYFDGKIDELKVYNRAISSTEVAALAAGVTFPTVSDAKKLDPGQPVTLEARSVTYAPRNAALNRTTTFFYIGEPDRSSVLRVEDGTTGQDAAVADSGATFSGVIGVNGTTGEKYLELTSPAEIESAPVVKPITATTEMVKTDPNLVGMPVKVACKVVAIATDKKSMTVSDGYQSGGTDALTTIKCEYGTIGTDLAAGNMITVTGIVTKTTATDRVILLKDYWRVVPPVDMMTYKLEEYFKFDETTGTTAADSSGNARNATTYNGPTWTLGKVGNCLNFDGTNDYASIPDMGTFSAITIAAWVRLDVLRAWQAVMHCDDWTANDTHLSFQDNGTLFFSVNGNNPVDVSSAAVFNSSTIGTWKHVAVVYDCAAKTVKFYSNGALLTTVTYSTAVPSGLTGGIKLGSWGGGDRWFDGAMDDYRIYSRALTDAEIANLYNAGYTITATAGSNGTITPSGAVSVVAGGNQTFTITGNPGYKVANVLVDGGSIGAVTSYTFSSVSANHTISATFTSAPNVTITATATGSGTVNPSGAVSVPYSGSQTFTFTPGSGQAVTGVTVDGASVGRPGSYTFSTVTSDHTIAVTFGTASGPLTWYKFDESSGTSAADSSGSNFTGTLVNGPTWAGGYYNNAVVLDGTNDYVSLPTGFVSGLNDFTISTWVKLDTVSAWSRIFDFGTGTATNMFLTPNSSASAARYAIRLSGGAEQQINGTAAVATGSWQHVAVTFTGSTGILYVNGVEVGRNTSMTLKPSSLGSTNLNYIGKSQYSDPYLDGMVDDFRIYDRALSASEIGQIYSGAM